MQCIHFPHCKQDTYLIPILTEYSVLNTRITHESGRRQAAARVVLLVLSHDKFTKGHLKTLIDLGRLTWLKRFMYFLVLLECKFVISCDNWSYGCTSMSLTKLKQMYRRRHWYRSRLSHFVYLVYLWSHAPRKLKLISMVNHDCKCKHVR